jgi:hypothetical protein
MPRGLHVWSALRILLSGFLKTFSCPKLMASLRFLSQKHLTKIYNLLLTIDVIAWIPNKFGMLRASIYLCRCVWLTISLNWLKGGKIIAIIIQWLLS